MEKDANYTIAGALSLVLLFGLAVFVVWLAKFQFNKTYDMYDILFAGPVRGLSAGGEVHFNGIKVGEITKVDLDPKDPSRVIARARLSSGVPVKRDSYASLEPQGITGVSYVQITSGSAAAPLLKTTVGEGETPVVQSWRGAVESLLQGGDTAVTQLVAAIGRANRVLSDDNIAAVTTTLADARAVADELRARKSLIADSQQALRDADAAARRLSQLEASGQSLLDGDGRRALRNAADATEEAKGAVRDLRVVLARAGGPTGDFASEGLPQVTASLYDFQSTSENLDDLLSEVRANPRAIVAKAPPRELEIKR
jgi:phospholipid/cholesterol/gamma-HCH transport system substrate-binding protein